METGTDTPPLYTLISGDSSLGYIDVETGTDTPPLYTLISGDVGTRGQLLRIYSYGDRDIKYHPYTLAIVGTVL